MRLNVVLKLVEPELSCSKRHTLRLSAVLKLVEPEELSCGKKHTREVECGVEAGGAGVELE